MISHVPSVGHLLAYVDATVVSVDLIVLWSYHGALIDAIVPCVDLIGPYVNIMVSCVYLIMTSLMS